MKFCIFFTFILMNCSFCKKYKNHTLYRGIPVNNDHLEFLKNLSKHYIIDFWRPPGKVNRPVEFLIAPEERSMFLREAADRELYLTTMIDDIQSAFDAQKVKTYIRRKTESFDWTGYFRLKDIYRWLHDLVKAHPGEMEMKSIGKSYENRNIMMVKINLNTSTSKRSKVIVEGGIHAREWAGPAFVTYFLHTILNAQTSNNKVLRGIAETYEWYFIPVLNVDGYEYSHISDRLWRKNRHGYGVDINRNFGIAFGSVGVSRNKKDETYCGPEAFSERESYVMSQFVKSKQNNVEFYFAFHSYGQYMITPYAHSKNHHDNFDEVKRMSEEAASQISRRYGTRYTVGTAYDTVGYLTSGVSGCWAKKAFGIPYVVTFELRDSGRFGFALPPDQIMPLCLETMDGMISLLRIRRPLQMLPPGNPESMSARQENTFLDKIVIYFCVLLFVVVHFD